MENRLTTKTVAPPLSRERLLTATLESYLAGHAGVALPGMLVSAVLFAGCLGVYRIVVAADKQPHDGLER